MERAILGREEGAKLTVLTILTINKQTLHSHLNRPCWKSSRVLYNHGTL